MPLSPEYQRPWPPRIQVAGVSSLEEALFCHSVGVDALGFTLELPHGLHDGLTNEKAAWIVSRLPKDTMPVVITYLTDADSACRLVSQVHGGAIQLHGGMSDEELFRFRLSCPHVKTIGMVTVAGENSLADAVRFQPPLWDAIILDSLDPSTGRTGATGLVHDWDVSARIVLTSNLPVILAGGLNPDNVGEAIEKVRPCGVDAHTGLEERDGTRSFRKIEAFARAASRAFQIPNPSR
jgi:phosphoribosylanthranilate isomerase